MEFLDSRLPKIIWMLWLQGWDKAPGIVQACLRTWQSRNPGWGVRALNAESIFDYLDAAALPTHMGGKDMPPEALSDVIRIALLERYGGIWVDGTVYCLKPLDAWLPELLASGFFAFAKPAPDRMLSSWFLAASKGNYLVREWCWRAQEYWTRRTERHHYFWFHYLFAEAYKADPHFRAIWNMTPQVLADKPHFYAPYEKLSAPVSSSDLLLMESPPTPVLKLTHKLPSAEYADGSILDHLCSRAEDSWHSACDAARAHPPPPGNLLITWYGSFDGQGTIGDLLAMQSAATHLVGLGHHVFHASATNANVVGSRRVDWRAASPRAFDALVFVCGPILRHHPSTRELFDKFDGIPRIGVGVSLFPVGHESYVNPFDEVLAREGQPERYEDVAIVAPASANHHARALRRGPPTIGIVLRGPQDEYGPELCLWERTERIANEAAKKLTEHKGGRIIQIENHLHRSGLSPGDIEAQYAECDLIITSRFHGATMALRHMVPFVAIDQIQGGGKVLNLLGATPWPFVHEAGGTSAAEVLSSATLLLSGDFDRVLLDVRVRAVENANRTLARLGELVRALPSRDQADRTDSADYMDRDWLPES